MTISDKQLIKTLSEKLSDNGNTLDSLRSQVKVCYEKVDMLSNIVETSNGSIANQLSAANYLLAIVAILIVVGGAILGFYIRRKKNEVEKMVRMVDEKRKLVDAMAAATKELDEHINSNIKGLYQKLRKEETDSLLERLVLEPQDIGNLIELLLARDLDDEGFVKIREAYLNLEPEQDDKALVENGMIRVSAMSHEEEYLLLFFQHYCYQAIKDDEIRPELIKKFRTNCNNAFKRDIIKTTIDLCRALTECTSTFNKEEVLTAYLKALNHSQYKSFIDLKNIFEQNIMPKSLLDVAKEQCAKDGEYLSLFGIDNPETGE